MIFQSQVNIEKYKFEVIEVKICTTEGQNTTEGKMCEL